jgi:hypothetical protein
MLKNLTSLQVIAIVCIGSMEPFEREAMVQLILTARSMASMLGTETYATKLRIWAQIVEDWLEKENKEGIKS